MKFNQNKNLHLTYCSNIHPGERWQIHFEELKIYLPELKRRCSPEAPFGVGLRLSALAANDILKDDNLASFRSWLKENGLYVFTMNGFPYGSFHHEKVKDNVYSPDWSIKERMEYTLDLARILNELLPEDIDGGISTSPISYKYWQRDTKTEQELIKSACKHLAEVAFEMSRYQEENGKELHLDIEPEPDCLIENSEESVGFFREHLWPIGAEYLEKEKGMSQGQAIEILKSHIRLCYDTCHFAVEYEDPEEAIKKITGSGIKIGKAQISAALKTELGDRKRRETIRKKLEEFVESTYLHQVVERRNDGSYVQYRDLDDALEKIDSPEAEEWRIHFHVPIFTGEMDELQSTRGHISDAFTALQKHSDCRHYEIETYTWEVLPKSLRMNLTDSIEREIKWFLGIIQNDGEENGHE